MDKQIKEIELLLSKCTTEQREFIFKELRKEFKIHPIEAKLNTQAEIILEAINKDDTGLTFRMMRGVIAEAAFEVEVVSKLAKWKNTTPAGDLPFDYLLNDRKGDVLVQVKLQRSVAFKPMLANQASRKFSSKLFVAETQKTRGGIDAATKEDTRPYRYGEFNILAISMHPSTGDWSSFMYTVSDWLIPQETDKTKMLKFQPVSPVVNVDWTDDFETCVKWFRKGIKKTIKF
jgi:hypothetical protein